MPSLRCRFPHPWCVILPGTALLCAATAGTPHHAQPASFHAAMQSAAVAVQARAVPSLASTGWWPPAQTGHAAPAAGARRAATPADEPPPGVPARVLLWSESVWATAHVLDADSLGACIACTSTQAGSNSSSSKARSIRVLTEAASEGQGPSNGHGGGELVALPPNPLLHLALGSWRASTTATESRSSGHAQAAVLDLGLARPGVLDLEVARASSDSGFSRRSGPSATSRDDALVAVVGGGVLRVVLLHSEASDSGAGSVQLASVNGTGVLQSGNPMLPDRIMVPNTVSLELLHADGDSAAAAAARDGKSQGGIGLSSGATGGGGTGPVEPLH
jgi:hypothetical protein